MIRSFRPRRVFDAGCALGFLVEAFWDRGVEAWGRDISHFAVSEVRADLRGFCELGSIADPIKGRFDLITCIEVLEHMPEATAIQAIKAMSAATDRILFSSSPTDLDEPTHVNVKPIIWWLRVFGAEGFAPLMSYDATFVTPHCVVLERVSNPPGEEIVAGYAEIVRLRLQCAERDQVIRDTIARMQASETAAQQALEGVAAARNEFAEEVVELRQKVANSAKGIEQTKAGSPAGHRDCASGTRKEIGSRRRVESGWSAPQEEELEKLRRDLETHLSSAQAERRNLIGNIARLQDALSRMEGDNQGILASTSWRMSLPFATRRRASQPNTSETPAGRGKSSLVVGHFATQKPLTAAAGTHSAEFSRSPGGRRCFGGWGRNYRHPSRR